MTLIVWFHDSPFAASLTGISISPAQRSSHEQASPILASPSISEKACSFASLEAPSFACKSAPTIPARTSWLPPLLPPLLFQLPDETKTTNRLPDPASSVTTPTRPLLRRCQSASTSIASSSFYSRTTASSDLTVSRQPSNISSRTFRTENSMRYGSPLTKEGVLRPEVPPIPEQWKTANRSLLPRIRPLRPSTRPGEPPQAFWQYGSQCDDSASWMTEVSATPERRDPSICHSTPQRNLTEGGLGTLSKCDGAACRWDSNPGQSRYMPTAPSPFANAKWIDLDDRIDRRGTKRSTTERECRGLDKKRQPQDC